MTSDPIYPKFLLWDFDGTLARRPGQWTDTVLGILRRAGFAQDMDREVVRPFMNAGFPWHEPERVRAPGQAADDWWQDLQPLLTHAFAQLAGVDDARAGELATEVRSTYLQPSAWVVFEDTTSTLEALTARGWRHIVLSNHVPELPRLMEDLGLAHHFEAIHTSAVIGAEKPNRAAFLHALSSLPPGAEVWMIGDNPVADAGGAEAAGIPAILVRTRAAGVRRCCQSLAGVIEILEGGEPIETPSTHG
jgi:putative hydrolase of the HAD superfamily